MSRIGKVPINLPKGVTVSQTGTVITVKGPKGELKYNHEGRVKVSIDGQVVTVDRHDDRGPSKAFHGLYHRLITTAIKGVTEQYTKVLDIQGTGYRAKMDGKNAQISVGYSHPIVYKAPVGITLAVPKETQITVTGSDKQVVGQVAAEIRALRPPDAYMGKGIRYAGEVIKLKEGKTGAK